MKTTILLPVYNDWLSLEKLLKKKFFLKSKKKFNILIINDNSYKKKYNLKNLNTFNKITIVNLKKNLGSQRAITVGLSFLKKINTDKVIIMDSDGEDNPALIQKMLNLSKENSNTVIVVNRSKRIEHFFFRIIYNVHIYFLFFATGKIIKFGNYSLLSKHHIMQLLNSHHSWIAYSSTIAQKFKKIFYIYAPKEKRYGGKSNMNILNLFYHCLRIHSVLKNNALFNLSFYNFVIFIFFSKSLFTFFLILSVTYLCVVNIIFYLSKLKQPKDYLKEIKNIEVIKK